MDYSDIIIISLLAIIIGLVLFRKDYTQLFNQSENFGVHLLNNIPQNRQNLTNTPYQNIQHYNPHEFTENNRNYNTHNFIGRNSNKNFNINERLENMKNNKTKTSVTIKNNSEYNNNNLDDSEISNDLGSLDDISLKHISRNSIIKKNKNKNIKNIKSIKSIKTEKKQNNKKNENITNKVIIDDYSEFDNIKSLNSMDNTLSDIVSVVEKD